MSEQKMIKSQKLILTAAIIIVVCSLAGAGILAYNLLVKNKRKDETEPPKQNESFRDIAAIIVPDGSISAYKREWADYAAVIHSDKDIRF
ncbi:MAG: hypothetical protein LBQ27_02705 [Clostridiales bacterium]|jgi:flagellar basal body-associated protein FliL|nr:hypothetical protein [Clostridiales bacterium]